MGDVDRHILAAVDGVSDSGSAVRWAAAEAERAGLALRLVHAWGRPESGAPGLPGISEVRGRALGELAAAVARVRRDHPSVRVSTALLDVPAPRGLLAAAEHAELVVVGSHRPRGIPGLFLGSVALAVAARAGCPVVLVPRGAGGAPADGDVVVGVRPPHAPGRVLEFATRAAGHRQRPLRAVYAWAPPPDWDTACEGDRTATARRELAGLQQALPETLRATARARPGRPARVLLAAVDDAGLLVLGRSGDRLGPVAREVCEHTGCPVAIVPHRR